MTTTSPPATAGDPRARRWLARVLAATVALLAACAAFILWVDPFQQYHLATRYPPRFYTLHHRYINPGLAKHQEYDTVLSGSSIMESTPNSAVARACSGAAVNLSMPAMSASEQRLMLETAFASKPIRRAILVLDFNEFAGAPDERQDIAGPLPTYLYDRDPFNDLPYLLSWNVLLRSWHIVTGDRSERFRSDPDAPWFWGDLKRFGRDEVLRGLDLEHLNSRFQQPQRNLAGMQASFERNLMPLLRAHPQTEFDLVWPPYSILVWLDFAQRDQLEPSLAFKRWVFTTTRDLQNVAITDLQSEEAITHDLDRYTDLYHFDPSINERVVQAACSKGARLDAAGVTASEESLRSQVAELQSPGGLARLTAPAAPPAPRR